MQIARLAKCAIHLPFRSLVDFHSGFKPQLLLTFIAQLYILRFYIHIVPFRSTRQLATVHIAQIPLAHSSSLFISRHSRQTQHAGPFISHDSCQAAAWLAFISRHSRQPAVKARSFHVIPAKNHACNKLLSNLALQYTVSLPLLSKIRPYEWFSCSTAS